MKYREIYDVLEKQQIDVPGFRFSDYSGWRSPWPVGKMDQNGGNCGTVKRISCRNRTALAAELRRLFDSDAA